MGTLWQDIRFGVRTLVKNPGFTVVALLTLALGIGANTALFSVVNGVLLNPLPYPQPDQLVTIHESKANFATGSISWPNFRDWRDDNQTFSSMAIYRRNSFTMLGTGNAEQVPGMYISSDFFRVLGVQPVIGRTFLKGEDEIGAAQVAIISGGFWKRKFANSPDVLGKNLFLDGKDYTIVGVIPENFDLFLRNSNFMEIYLPIGQWGNNLLTDRGSGIGIHGIGRMKPGVSFAQAKDDMGRVSRNLAVAYPNKNKGIAAALITFKQTTVGDIQPFLLALLAAVGFVLLIACVNVANLLLARSTARSREFAIRASLGAGQGRLVRQLLTESILLALIGGGLGIVLASWATQAALSRLPLAMPRAGEVGLDSHVLIFTAAVSLLAGLFFGLAPAIKTSRTNLHDTLKESGRGGSGSRHRAHGVFVVVEMAMALILLIGAGLMIRTLAALSNADPGFNPQGVLTFGLSLPPAMTKTNPAAVRAAFCELDARIRAIPGVANVSLSWAAVPMASDDETLFWPDGQQKPSNPNDMKWALQYVIEPDYLKAMRIPLKAGRFFTAQDDEHAPLVIVIDEVLAKQYFGNENPVGKRLNLDQYNAPAEIIGVVGHVKQWGIDSDDSMELRAQMYRSFMQLPDPAMMQAAPGTGVIVRSDGSASGIATPIRESLQAMNSQQVVSGTQSMESIISDTFADRRFSMTVLGVFAALALLLASVGIYGVISYLVGQRVHEIGIRVALGAQPRDVLRLVLGQGARMALLGVGIGLVAAVWLTKLMSTMLFGVSPTDPLAFAAAAILLTMVALSACYIPARRAIRVDPIIALRCD